TISISASALWLRGRETSSPVPPCRKSKTKYGTRRRATGSRLATVGYLPRHAASLRLLALLPSAMFSHSPPARCGGMTCHLLDRTSTWAASDYAQHRPLCNHLDAQGAPTPASFDKLRMREWGGAYPQKLALATAPRDRAQARKRPHGELPELV